MKQVLNIDWEFGNTITLTFTEQAVSVLINVINAILQLSCIYFDPFSQSVFSLCV